MFNTSVRHPDQPIILDEEGTVRFHQNAIVRFLLNNGPHDWNSLSTMFFTDDDRNQFAQLAGYSVCGFGELPYADPERVARADQEAEHLLTIHASTSV